METFFDLREFFIIILKKVKLCIILTIIFTILGGLVRFVPLIKDYLTYTEPQIEDTELIMQEFPYQYQARRTLYIEPLLTELNGIIVDQSSVILNAYLACYQNKEILQPLVEQYYNLAAKADSNYRQRLVDYNYETKSILDKIYSLPNFYDEITIVSVGKNYISIYATTGERELSEQIVTEAEQLMTAQVRRLVGNFNYTVTEGQIGQLSPKASQGLVPKAITTQHGNASNQRPEIPVIIKRSLKGGIWGMGLGIGVFIILCFLFNCVGLIINTEGDLKTYPVKTIVSVRINKKKHFLGFIDYWIEMLEGNNKNCNSSQTAAQMVKFYIDSILNDIDIKKIIVTGSGNYDHIKKFAEELKKNMTKESGYDFVLEAECITITPEAVKIINSGNAIILVEELGSSSKQEIAKEIERIQYLNKLIVGIVLLK